MVSHRSHDPGFKVRILVSLDDLHTGIQMQVYVREHYHKSVRQTLEEQRLQVYPSSTLISKGRKRTKYRRWTLNRSPHGNKTAREQFGRQTWKRTRVFLSSSHVPNSVKSLEETRTHLGVAVGTWKVRTRTPN